MSAPSPEITRKEVFPVRRPNLDFESAGSAYYVRGNAFASHLMSGLNLSFLESEPFIVQTMQHFKNRIQDPKLLSEIKNFGGQETQHKNQVDLFLRRLEMMGYNLTSWKGWIKWFFQKFMSWMPYSLQLAFTAGLEIQATSFFYSGLKYNILNQSDLTMRRFLLWHAVEELEHKHVAFDVLQTVYPKNYPLRIFGYLLSLIGGHWIACYGMNKLTWQDLRQGRLDFKGLKGHFKYFISNSDLRNFIKHFYLNCLNYFKPSFHPKQINDQSLLDYYRPELLQFTQ